MDTEKRMPAGITEITPGGTRRQPISVLISNSPCCGISRRSPSWLTNAWRCISASKAY